MNIKKADRIQVVAGKESGKSGKVLRVDRTRNRVVVEGLNIIKRHKKPSAADREGGIVTREAPFDASNVLLFSEKLGRGVRTSVRFLGKNGELHATKKAAQDSFGSEQPERIGHVRMCLKTGEVF